MRGRPRTVEVAGITDRGTTRAENQDRWSATQLEGGALLVVCADGMGGHRGGGEAATVAVDAAVLAIAAAGDPHRALEEAFRAAGSAVLRIRTAGERSGTTLVAAVVSPGRTTVANVGDSRAYLLRDGRISQITVDHSWVAAAVARGHLDAGLAASHPGRGHLLRAITGDPVEVDVFRVRSLAGDVLVVCTDGVWTVLGDAVLAASFPAAGRLPDQVERVCRGALTAGSRDNVTVVACRM
ncbi:MAG: PP2C family protein-serine/threonine phosphatase [Candidatus Dormibacteria bacterium]